MSSVTKIQEATQSDGVALPSATRLLRASLSYGALQYVVLVIAFVKGIYVARYLGPELLGSYGLVVLITEYLRFANLGVYSAMNLEVSTARRQDATAAEVLERVVSSAWTYALLTGLIFAAAALIIRTWFSEALPVEVSRYLYVLCFIGFSGQFRIFTLTHARLEGRYRLINVLEFIASATVLMVIVLFGAEYKLDAAIAGMLLASAITFVIGLVTAVRAKVVRIRFDRIPALIAVGVPLFIYTTFEQVFGTLDRWMIVTWLPREDLGYYTLSYALATSSLVLLSAFTYISYPNFLGSFHLASDAPAEKQRVLESLKRRSGTLAGVAIGLGVMGMVVVEPLIAQFLPQYGRSVALYRILMIGLLAQRIAYLAATFLVANRRQNLLVGLLVISLPVTAGLGLLAIRREWGVEGVAAASATGLTFYALLMVVAALRAMEGLDLRNVMLLFGKYALLLAIVVPLMAIAPGHFYIALIAFILIYAKENGELLQMAKAWRPV